MAKRAWMSLTNMLKSQFKVIQIATSVRDSTSRLLHVFSRRLTVPFKTSYLQNTSPRAHFRSEEKVLERKKEEKGAEEIVDSLEDAWRIVVGGSPHLRVDDVSRN